MRLWYWLSNSDFANLNIYNKELSSEERVILNELKISTASWTRVDINISSSSDPQLVFIRLNLHLK